MDDYLFSYATREDPPVKRGLIRLVERATGQPHLKRLYVDNQRNPRPNESFWQAAVRCAEARRALRRRGAGPHPEDGPVVVVANHPYGVLDGIVISWLIEKVRAGFRGADQRRADARAGSAGFHPADRFQRAPRRRMQTNLRTRARRRATISSGAAAWSCFRPAAVSTAPDRLGRHPAVDGRWQPFVAQLIQRSKATVAPIWFGGQNSRLFQIASHVSQTLRISLIFHEVKARIGAELPVADRRADPVRTARSRSRTGRRWPTSCARCTYALAIGRSRGRRKINPARKNHESSCKRGCKPQDSAAA